MADLSATNLFDVKGLVAVVTGGGTGIGLMMAATLENNGAIVYIVGRRFEVLEKAAKEHSKYGNIIPLKGDVTSRESLLSLASQIKSDRGHIDLLVNNSGVLYNLSKAPEPTDSITDFQSKLWNAGTPEEWTKTFDVNVSAVYYTTVAFLELLDAGNKKRGVEGDVNAVTSQVITVSSIGGLRRDAGVFSISYGASKAAATHMGKTLANTLKPWKIRSNVIAPGMYPSEMTVNLMTNGNKVSADQVPLERYGTTEDMGGLVLFLASKAGAYISGGVHVTDGGRLGLFSSSF